MSAEINDSGWTRRAVMAGLGAATVLAARPVFARTPGMLVGAGNFRSLSMVNKRTGEWIKTVYWVEGEYIPDAMKAFNHLLRDWRQDAVHNIDPRTIDILSATHSLLDCSEPFDVISGYRTPQTNNMLRRRSRGVASNSYHLKGMACDITMKTRSVRQISRAGMALGAGGVGRYTRSQFVHLDSGPVRKWGS